MWDFSVGQAFGMMGRTLPFIVFRIIVYAAIAVAYVLVTGVGAGVGWGIGAFGDQIRRKLALFDGAMKMFTPFALAQPATETAATAAPKAEAAPPSDDALNDLKKRMEEMQAQIEKLASKS